MELLFTYVYEVDSELFCKYFYRIRNNSVEVTNDGVAWNESVFAVEELLFGLSVGIYAPVV